MNVYSLINKMTLEEKCAMLQGWTTWTTREISHLGIPAAFLSDGPHGLRKQAGAGDHLGLNASVPAPGPGCAMGLARAVREGRIDEAVLDDRIRELLKVLLPAVEAVREQPGEFDPEAHHGLAKKCAAGSIVLLENDGILPLRQGTEVALIGDFAAASRYQGAGSSLVNPTKVEHLRSCARQAGLRVAGYARGFDRTACQPDEKLISEAVSLAKRARVVLLCVGLDEILESEGMDRSHMKLSQAKNELITRVCEANDHVVLVLSGGAPFELPDVRFRACIHGYLGGQAGAAAMADALVGKINPSGKLNETWPLKLEDNPSYPYYPSRERTSEYREGLYVGYRYFDTAGIPVRWPFGYGLSYTTFAYSDLQLSEKQVRFTLTNTGSRDGAEVVQVYVSGAGHGVFRPRKELKGFAKVCLRAGESKAVNIDLDGKAFRYFNTKTNRWEIESGAYEILVAASVADVKLSGWVQISGTDAPAPYGPLPAYESGRIENVPDAEYAALLGRPIPNGKWSGLLEKNDAICQMGYAKSLPARMVYQLLERRKQKADSTGKPDLNIHFIFNMPFRAIGKMSAGAVSEAMVGDILAIVNGHFFRGVGKLAVDFFRNRRGGKAYLRTLEEKERSHESV